MRILLVASGYNSMTQRMHAELADRGYEVSVELALGDDVLRERSPPLQPGSCPRADADHGDSGGHLVGLAVLVLLWTAVRLFTHRDADPDVAGSPLVRATRRLLPVTDSYDGGRLITRAHGRRVVTPLFIVFIAIGGTDMLFALDSIPAVFGVTSEAYIVFAADAFALLGLRALYFMVTGLLDRLVYLSAGLAVILAFIGAKLILHWAHGLSAAIPEISTALSLAVIGGVLALTTAASLIKSRRDPGARAHAGAVLGTHHADPAQKTAPR